MSTTDAETLELTDPELISRVREGDVSAYGTLFARHRDAATRLARVQAGGSDADDLVSEAFVKVLNVLLDGGGPDVAFRAYLLTAVRRLHIDRVRGQKKLTTTDDLTPFDPGVPFTDTAVAGFEGGAAAKAFASLPERWQLVLWHLEVENQKPAEIAPLLGMTANSVSALAYRAREGLRQAFLTMHAGDLVSEGCRDTNNLIGGYVRHALSRRDAAKVEDHLDHCRRCTAVYLELSEVNSSLAALLGPVLLGAAAAGYLGGGAAAAAGAAGAGVSAAAGAVSAGAGAVEKAGRTTGQQAGQQAGQQGAVGAGSGTGAAASGASSAIGRIRDLALANLPATAAAAVTAVGVASIAGIAIVNRGPDSTPTAADPPQQVVVASSQTPSATPSSLPSTSSSALPSGLPTPSGSLVPTAGFPSSSLSAFPTGLGDLSGLVDNGDDDASGTDDSSPADGTGAQNGNQNGDPNGNPNGNGNGSSPTRPATPKPSVTPTDPTNPTTPTNPTSPTSPTPTDPEPTDPTPTDPEPTDPEPTDPTPTDPEPTDPAPRADVQVQASGGYWRYGRLHVRVRITGVPAGETVRVIATSSAGRVHSHPRVACGRPAGVLTCTIRGNRSLEFGLDSRSSGPLTVSVSPPEGWTDPTPGNNTVSVSAPQRR